MERERERETEGGLCVRSLVQSQSARLGLFGRLDISHCLCQHALTSKFAVASASAASRQHQQERCRSRDAAALDDVAAIPARRHSLVVPTAGH